MYYYHCSCNFIPHAYEWFDMGDLACLIAPRRLILVAGEKDPLFRVKGVEESFDTIKKIYEKENCTERCKLLKTPEAHRWCKDTVWKAIKEETAKMGW